MTAPVLRGPADADHFRVQVGRYGDRWYHDPLPADTVAPATTDVYPSVSTCKKASGSDWSAVALKRVADALEERSDRLTGMGAAERYEALKAINKLGLESASKRGTNVHQLAEDRLYGRSTFLHDLAPGAEYRGAVDAFFDTYQPALVAAEFVCINRTLNQVGYGGTCDAAVTIDGATYIIDWKSRSAESNHGAYPEEAAQLAAYARAQYMIVEGGNGPERRPLPVFDGGLIVSIKPDGCRVYPIDLDAGFAHWSALHGWWCARRHERDAVGRTWPARKTPAAIVIPATWQPAPPPAPVTVDTSRRDWVRRRCRTLATLDPDAGALLAATWPTDLPPLSGDHQHSDVEIDRIDLLLAPLEAAVSAPFDPDPATSTFEGSPAGTDVVAAVRARFAALTPDRTARYAAIANTANDVRSSFRLSEQATQRRVYLNQAVLTLLEHDIDDDDIRRLLATVWQDDTPLLRSVALGPLIGGLDVVQAGRFREAAAYHALDQVA